MSEQRRLAGFSMPPEWVRHERTWMEFPPANTTFGDDPDGELGEYRGCGPRSPTPSLASSRCR